MEDNGRDQRATDEATNHIDQQGNGRGEFDADSGDALLELLEFLQQKVWRPFHNVVEERHANHCITYAEDL